MSLKTDYAEIIKLSKENPINRKRLLVINPEVKLTKDEILEIMTNDPEIKHFLVHDKHTDIGTVNDQKLISLDFSDYKGPSKKTYLKTVITKQLGAGGSVLVWNYEPPSLPYNRSFLWHVARVPDTKGKFGIFGEGSGGWPGYFNGVETLGAKYATIKSFFEDKNVKGTTFAIADCEGHVDIARNEIIMGDSLHRLINMEAGEIYHSDVDDDGTEKSKYVIFLNKDVKHECLKNAIEFILARELGHKTERTIVLVGSIELSELEIYKLVPGVDNSYILHLYASIIDRRKRAANRALLLKNSNPSASPQPVHVVGDNINYIDLSYLNKTNTIKHGVKVVLVSLTKQLYIDCYYKLLSYSRLNPAINSFFFIPNDKGSVNYVDTISGAVKLYMDCVNWKDPIESKTLFFFHHEGEEIDIDALISKLGESEYYIKYLSTVGSYDIQNQPETETSFRLREKTYPKSSEDVAGFYKLVLNEQNGTEEKVTRIPSEKEMECIEWITHNLDKNLFGTLKDGVRIEPIIGGWDFYAEDTYFSFSASGGEKDLDIECSLIARITDSDLTFPRVFAIPTKDNQDTYWLLVPNENLNGSELLVLEITGDACKKIIL